MYLFVLILLCCGLISENAVKINKQESCSDANADRLVLI